MPTRRKRTPRAHTFNLRLSDAEMKQLRTLAEKEQTSAAVLIRRLVLDAFRRRESLAAD